MIQLVLGTPELERDASCEAVPFLEHSILPVVQTDGEFAVLEKPREFWLKEGLMEIHQTEYQYLSLAEFVLSDKWMQTLSEYNPLLAQFFVCCFNLTLANTSLGLPSMWFKCTDNFTVGASFYSVDEIAPAQNVLKSENFMVKLLCNNIAVLIALNEDMTYTQLVQLSQIFDQYSVPRYIPFTFVYSAERHAFVRKELW